MALNWSIPNSTMFDYELYIHTSETTQWPSEKGVQYGDPPTTVYWHVRTWATNSQFQSLGACLQHWPGHAQQLAHGDVNYPVYAGQDLDAWCQSHNPYSPPLIQSLPRIPGVVGNLYLGLFRWGYEEGCGIRECQRLNLPRQIQTSTIPYSTTYRGWTTWVTRWCLFFFLFTRTLWFAPVYMRSVSAPPLLLAKHEVFIVNTFTYMDTPVGRFHETWYGFAQHTVAIIVMVCWLHVSLRMYTDRHHARSETKRSCWKMAIQHSHMHPIFIKGGTPEHKIVPLVQFGKNESWSSSILGNTHCYSISHLIPHVVYHTCIITKVMIHSWIYVFEKAIEFDLPGWKCRLILWRSFSTQPHQNSIWSRNP